MSSIAERTMNVEALQTAIRALTTPQQAEGIEYLYVLLDDSMKKGYAAGAEDARDRANDYWNTQVEQERDAAWDQGYLQGVGDARARPGQADNIVQDIIADGAAAYYDAAEEAVDNWTAYRESVRD
jgi:hypothetical protein